MQIKLNNTYSLRSDDLNYILDRKITSKTGQVSYRTIGYYNKLETVVNALLNLEVKSSDLESLNELIDRMDKVEREVAENLSNYVNKDVLKPIRKKS